MAKVRISLAVLALGVLASCGTSGTTSSSSSTSPPPRSTTAPAVPMTTAPPASLDPYLGLWPFQSGGEVQAWQRAYASNGQDSWHLDAGTTALNFTMSYLGFKEINVVVGTTMDATGAHVTVGYRPTSSVTARAAIIHLVRWGTGSDAPWEVVGTDDTTFSLTTPAYGATATSPMRVGGTITGVDENIRVTVRQASGPTPLGTFCCQAAGGTGSAWSASVTFSAATSSVVTVIATTGGHVQTIERFTVTGVHPGAG